jgi:hypothetical protein
MNSCNDWTFKVTGTARNSGIFPTGAIGTKSFTGSYGSFSYSVGLTASGPAAPKNSV